MKREGYIIDEEGEGYILYINDKVKEWGKREKETWKTNGGREKRR